MVFTQGFPEYMKKLTSDYLIGPPLKGAMQATREYGDRTAHRRVPIQRVGTSWGSGESGRLAAAISSRLDAREVPLYAAVEIPHLPLGTDGFRYGFALNASPRYHYQTGNKRVKGKPTKGWWSGVRSLMRSYLRRQLRQAMRQIEQRGNR